jgi:hypothetical protein
MALFVVLMIGRWIAIAVAVALAPAQEDVGGSYWNAMA